MTTTHKASTYVIMSTEGCAQGRGDTLLAAAIDMLSHRHVTDADLPRFVAGDSASRQRCTAGELLAAITSARLVPGVDAARVRTEAQADLARLSAEARGVYAQD